jgi:hypothetical protein
MDAGGYLAASATLGVGKMPGHALFERGPRRHGVGGVPRFLIGRRAGLLAAAAACRA